MGNGVAPAYEFRGETMSQGIFCQAEANWPGHQLFIQQKYSYKDSRAKTLSQQRTIIFLISLNLASFASLRESSFEILDFGF